MSAKKLSAARAVAMRLERFGFPVFLRYDIARVAWGLYRARRYGDLAIDVQLNQLDYRAFARVESALLETGVINPVPGMPERSVFSLLGGNISDKNSLACAIDPFSYISHLSAMEFHGLTDRMPEKIYVSTPASAAWTTFARERMQKDLGEDFDAYWEAGLPKLKRVVVDKIGQRPIQRFASVHLGAFRALKDSPMRVSTLGRTFLDMLREPSLCGGLNHVLRVFREHAPSYRRLIFDELDQQGTAIDKVRAGFILETVCKLQDPRIDAWVAFAARGGSRKLDATTEYAPQFSDRWCLSINASLPLEAGDD